LVKVIFSKIVHNFILNLILSCVKTSKLQNFQPVFIYIYKKSDSGDVQQATILLREYHRVKKKKVNMGLYSICLMAIVSLVLVARCRNATPTSKRNFACV
jgi:hypothetical protein